MLAAGVILGLKSIRSAQKVNPNGAPRQALHASVPLPSVLAAEHARRSSLKKPRRKAMIVSWLRPVIVCQGEVSMDDMRRAKDPVTVLAGPYGHPFHPILVTVPIGAWVASLVFDLGSLIATGDAAALATGSRWLIAIGVLGAAAAALVWFLDLFAIPTRTRAFRTALVHMGLNLTITAAYLINFLLRLGQQGSAPIGLVIMSALCIAALGLSGYLGGKLAFQYGVRVADEQDQAAGFGPTSTAKD